MNLLLISIILISVSGIVTTPTFVLADDSWKLEQLTAKHQSDESKMYDIFLIYHKLSTGNVSFSTSGDDVWFTGFVFDVETSQADNLEIKIPRNFPYTNSANTFGKMLVLINGEENHDHILKMTDCFLQYSIPVNENLEIELAPMTLLVSDPPFIGENVPNHCLVETLLLPPKQQIKNGIAPKDIICRDNLELIFKSSDNSPACVKPETKNVLDWRVGISCLVIMTDKEKYKIGESISVTIKNNCAKPLQGSGGTYFTIFDSKGIAYCCSGSENITILKPGETDYEIWDQMGISNKVEPGIYEIRSHIPSDSGYKKTSKWFEIIG